MSLTVFDGLPTHVLLVHAVVVLVPLTALAVVVGAAWPGAARRMGLALPLLALVTLAFVPFTTHAGEWLRNRLPPSELIDRHAGLGDGLLPWVVALVVVAAAVWWLTRYGAMLAAVRTGPRDAGQPGSGPRSAQPPARVWRAVRALVALSAVTAAAGAVTNVYRIGDSGAKAVWNGVLAQPAHPPPSHTPDQLRTPPGPRHRAPGPAAPTRLTT